MKVRMNWSRRGTTPLLEQEGWPKAGVVVRSKWFSLVPTNEWDGELFDSSTTPALRATPPVPGGELFLLLLQFIHNQGTIGLIRSTDVSAPTINCGPRLLSWQMYSNSSVPSVHCILNPVFHVDV